MPPSLPWDRTRSRGMARTSGEPAGTAIKAGAEGGVTAGLAGRSGFAASAVSQ